MNRRAIDSFLSRHQYAIFFVFLMTISTIYRLIRIGF